MIPSEITPVILTYNEAPNIGRLLHTLRWAGDVVIVDSGSTDDTARIVGQFANARFIVRAFDGHARQWNYAIGGTGIATPWILALDADYIPPPSFLEDVSALGGDAAIGGYRARFDYAIQGRVLRGGAYPPVTVLFRRGRGAYVQDGHTQRLQVEGAVAPLRSRFTHDDRKPLRHWLASQASYAALEFEKIRAAPLASLGWPDRVRKASPLAPALMFLYCLFAKGNILDGRAGLYYACQRAFAELLLLLHFFDFRLRGEPTLPREK